MRKWLLARFLSICLNGYALITPMVMLNADLDRVGDSAIVRTYNKPASEIFWGNSSQHEFVIDKVICPTARNRDFILDVLQTDTHAETVPEDKNLLDGKYIRYVV